MTVTTSSEMTRMREWAAKLWRKVTELEAENKRLRRSVDNIKIRSYELGQRELHDMAWSALKENNDDA